MLVYDSNVYAERSTGNMDQYSQWMNVLCNAV